MTKEFIWFEIKCEIAWARVFLRCGDTVHCAYDILWINLGIGMRQSLESHVVVNLVSIDWIFGSKFISFWTFSWNALLLNTDSQCPKQLTDYYQCTATNDDDDDNYYYYYEQKSFWICKQFYRMKMHLLCRSSPSLRCIK